MNRYFKIFWTLIFCLVFTATTAFAASNTDSKGIRAYRSSMYETMNDSQKVFHQYIRFGVPDVKAELDFNGKIDGHTLNLAGALDFSVISSAGENVPINIPFYIAQNGNSLDIYYKTDDKWSKYAAPSVAAELTDIIVSPTKQEIDEEIKLIKSVKILHENDSRRTLLVTIDGKKLADEFKFISDKNPADKGTQGDENIHNDFMFYLDAAFRKNDISYVWTIDKKNHQSRAISVDLSNLIRDIALSVLNDPNQNFGDAASGILEVFAFYSDFKMYATFLDNKAQSTLTVPQEVIESAVEVKDVVPDKIPDTVTK